MVLLLHRLKGTQDWHHSSSVTNKHGTQPVLGVREKLNKWSNVHNHYLLKVCKWGSLGGVVALPCAVWRWLLRLEVTMAPLESGPPSAGRLQQAGTGRASISCEVFRLPTQQLLPRGQGGLTGNRQFCFRPILPHSVDKEKRKWTPPTDESSSRRVQGRERARTEASHHPLPQATQASVFLHKLQLQSYLSWKLGESGILPCYFISFLSLI